MLCCCSQRGKTSLYLYFIFILQHVMHGMCTYSRKFSWTLAQVIIFCPFASLLYFVVFVYRLSLPFFPFTPFSTLAVLPSVTVQHMLMSSDVLYQRFIGVYVCPPPIYEFAHVFHYIHAEKCTPAPIHKLYVY